MRVAPTIELTSEEHAQLTTWSRGNAVPHRLVLRSQIILLASEHLENQEIAHRLGVPPNRVCRWRGRFASHRLAGIERDEPRPGRPREITPGQVQRVVDTVRHEKPPNATHWSVRTLARALGMKRTTVNEILRQHDLKPHVTRSFKLSKNPRFVEKLRDVVGLYLNPPERALVLSYDEKSQSQIQALESAQLNLPIREGLPEGRSHDYRRNGTITLFAVLNVLDGKVIGECMKRHRHQEFLRFLERVDGETPLGLDLHVILDNYAAHKHPRVMTWPRKHPRWHFHFTPSGSSWLNLVERWFREITTKRIRRGSFGSVKVLIDAIEEYIQNNSGDPTVFVWSASAERILEKIRLVDIGSDAIHPHSDRSCGRAGSPPRGRFPHPR